jgi:hypothetical protein
MIVVKTIELELSGNLGNYITHQQMTKKKFKKSLTT